MNDPHLVRRLTTILALDVVAFSTMSAQNEEPALALLGVRLDMAGALVRQHRGRVFKLTGDGLLAEFASPVEAVRAALEIQEAMRSVNAAAGPAEQLELRIGINLGDVVENGDDLMGDAVNVAVRLESIAMPGAICVSASVYEQIIGKLMLDAEDIGEQHVKNIPRPIHTYRLTPGGSRTATVHPVHRIARASPRSRAALVGAALIALAAAAVGSSVLLRGYTAPASPQIAQPSSVAAVAPVSATPPQPRAYVAREVPFVPDFRWRALENYASAEGSKALALNVRGIFAIAARRVDEAAARQAALGECNRIVRKQVPVVHDFDRCMLYAAGNEVVWSFRSPPMPPAPYVPVTRPQPAIPLDPSTVPLLGVPARQKLAEHYLTAKHSRALVLGRNHFDWWTPSETDADAIRRNLQICGHLTDRPCAVYALNNDVLVHTPRGMRAVDVFTPQDLVDLDASQQRELERYLVASDWRAVALGRNGRIGIASGRPDEKSAADEARRACTQAGGADCTITAIGPFLVAPN